MVNSERASAANYRGRDMRVDWLDGLACWSTHGRMIELRVSLSDEQLAEIAERAAALVAVDRPPSSPWLNVADAAEHLRCGKDRIYDLIALHKLSPRRDGRRVLLHRDDLDAYIEGRAA